MGITEPELVKYLTPREEIGNCPLSKFGKEFCIFSLIQKAFSEILSDKKISESYKNL